MAKVSYVDVPSALKEDYSQALQSGDRFIVPNMRKKSAQISRKKREALNGRTYLHKCSELWKQTSDAEQQNWHDYDFHEQQHGWRRFVEEVSTRINLGINTINLDNYADFEVNYPDDDWIESIHIENQDGNVLLDVGPYSYAPDGHRNNTDKIIKCEPGDTLTIEITVNAASTSWVQALSWGHDINSDGLTTVADLYKSDNCPWTHTYNWEVPDKKGIYLIAWWEHYYDYDSGTGSHDYAERQSYTLNIGNVDIKAPPANQYHQDLTGKVLIESPQDEAKLIQPHPKSYWKKTKVVGKDSMFEPSKVTESLSLPLKIGLSYKTDLASTAADASAQFYALVRHLYQGQNLDYKLAIDLPLSGGWNRQTATLSDTAFDIEPKGKVVSYDLYIHLYKVTGTLLFDHVLAQHSGSNWARDPFCDEVSRTFTKRFFQIPKHWYLLTDVSGITYGSVYPG